MVRRVVLIDDDAAVLESLEAVFSSANYEVRSFPLATDFLAALPGLSPACIVTDLRMPEMDGLTLVSKLTGEKGLSWPIVVISGHGDVPDAVAAIRAGATDFLIKPFPPQKLLAIVQASLSSRLATPAPPETDVDLRYASLSQRERQVVEILTAGGSSKSAGLALGISPRTVDVFRGRIMRKMAVNNIASLATAVAAVSPAIRDAPKTA
ncbi:response regulator transcription factor [Brevundimonas sp. DC300-4]|uniref:response regulator transcription factor n=1 Tax=Brevundimonas sp. DC300-4 TaxID=2804594 RepID=UPI003CEDD114